MSTQNTLTLEGLNRIQLTELNNTETCKLVEDLFSYHKWDADKEYAGEEVRETLTNAYVAILAHVPPSPSRTRALNAVLDARMLANQAITFEGKV